MGARRRRKRCIEMTERRGRMGTRKEERRGWEINEEDKDKIVK